jgi:hypothetical protein
MSTAPEVPTEEVKLATKEKVTTSVAESPKIIESDESKALETRCEIQQPHRLSRQRTLLNTAAIAALWQDNKRFDQWPGKSGLVIMSNIIVMAAEAFTIVEHRMGVEERTEYDNLEALTLFVDSLVTAEDYNRDLMRYYAKESIIASLPLIIEHAPPTITLGSSLSENGTKMLSQIPGVSHISDEKDGKISVYIVDARARRRIPPRLEGKEVVIKAARYPLDNEEAESLLDKAKAKLLAIPGVINVEMAKGNHQSLYGFERFLVYITDANVEKSIPTIVDDCAVEVIQKVSPKKDADDDDDDEYHAYLC